MTIFFSRNIIYLWLGGHLKINSSSNSINIKKMREYNMAVAKKKTVAKKAPAKKVAAKKAPAKKAAKKK